MATGFIRPFAVSPNVRFFLLMLCGSSQDLFLAGILMGGAQRGVWRRALSFEARWLRTKMAKDRNDGGGGGGEDMVEVVVEEMVVMIVVVSMGWGW